MTGELVKMKIVACTDSAYTEDSATPPYVVMANPEKYTIDHSIDFNLTQGQGTSGGDARYNRTRPQTMNFDFIFDGTGILNAAGGLLGNLTNPAAISVPLVGPFASETAFNLVAEIEKFKACVLEFRGDHHEPRYVKLVWGTLLFKGRLSSLKIDYKLFRPDGTPLRAVATCSFTDSIDDELRAAKERRQSADITHIRKVNEGDHLDQLAFDVYGDSSRYIEVAKANGITNFRKLKTGLLLSFPPIEKTT
jgi:phage tail protein X